MTRAAYLNFDLKLERNGAAYRAFVVRSPAGAAAGQFRFPLSDAALDRLLYEAGFWKWEAPRQQIAGEYALQAAREIGSQLFEALFAQNIGAALRRSLDLALDQGRGLRLRLDLAAVPELARVPWELLYAPGNANFLCRSLNTPVTRHIDLPSPPPIHVLLPLQVLVAIAAPFDYSPLVAEREWNDLNIALSNLVRAGLLSLERLERPTPERLRTALLSNCNQIVQLIGHGDFDAKAGESMIVLENEAGQGLPYGSGQLARLFEQVTGSGLVLLNTFNGTRISRSDRCAGIGQRLLHQGIPAVIATQSALDDAATAPFAHALYDNICAEQPLEAALSAARAASARGDSVGWAGPVLYTRSNDGMLFRFSDNGETTGGQRQQAVNASRLPGTYDLAAALLAG